MPCHAGAHARYDFAAERRYADYFILLICRRRRRLIVFRHTLPTHVDTIVRYRHSGTPPLLRRYALKSPFYARHDFRL